MIRSSMFNFRMFLLLWAVGVICGVILAATHHFAGGGSVSSALSLVRNMSIAFFFIGLFAGRIERTNTSASESEEQSRSETEGQDSGTSAGAPRGEVRDKT